MVYTALGCFNSAVQISWVIQVLQTVGTDDVIYFDYSVDRLVVVYLDLTIWVQHVYLTLCPSVASGLP